MLTGLTVRNFRCLSNLTLDSLGRINLIAGRNGAGKTSLLEALWLFGARNEPGLGIRADAFRGLTIQTPRTFFRNIFHEFDTQKQIEIIARGNWGNEPRRLDLSLSERTVRRFHNDGSTLTETEPSARSRSEGGIEIVFEYRHDDGGVHRSRVWWSDEGIHEERNPVAGWPVSYFMSAVSRESLQNVAAVLGDLQLQGLDGEMLTLLRKLEPRLEGVTPIIIGDTIVIHAKVKGEDRLIPVRLMGEGFSRMFDLATFMSTARGGLLMIDEIENGLHHSVFEDIFSVLPDLARTFDVQVFATTHSAECIEAAHRALGQQGDQEFSFHRLDRRNGEIRAVHFDHEMLETSASHSMEVR